MIGAILSKLCGVELTTLHPYFADLLRIRSACIRHVLLRRWITFFGTRFQRQSVQFISRHCFHLLIVYLYTLYHYHNRSLVYAPATTQIHSSLLSISVGALLLPAAYHFALSRSNEETAQEQKQDILRMSRGVNKSLSNAQEYTLIFYSDLLSRSLSY